MDNVAFNGRSDKSPLRENLQNFFLMIPRSRSGRRLHGDHARHAEKPGEVCATQKAGPRLRLSHHVDHDRSGRISEREDRGTLRTSKEQEIRRHVMEDLKNFCCQNKNCEKYGCRSEENIRVRARYGPGKKTRLLNCLVCKEKFSEHRGTVFFDSRLPKEKVVALLEHVAEGNGMRKTSRLEKTYLQTVIRDTRLAGEHAEELHEELVGVSPKDGGTSARRKVYDRLDGRSCRSCLDNERVAILSGL